MDCTLFQKILINRILKHNPKNYICIFLSLSWFTSQKFLTFPSAAKLVIMDLFSLSDFILRSMQQIPPPLYPTTSCNVPICYTVDQILSAGTAYITWQFVINWIVYLSTAKICLFLTFSKVRALFRRTVRVKAYRPLADPRL